MNKLGINLMAPIVRVADQLAKPVARHIFRCDGCPEVYEAPAGLSLRATWNSAIGWRCFVIGHRLRYRCPSCGEE
jgi:hypothetical protein